jgi:hypothetical protein
MQVCGRSYLIPCMDQIPNRYVFLSVQTYGDEKIIERFPVFNREYDQIASENLPSC